MIGIYPFLCRFLSTEWVTLQTIHLTKTGSRRCAKRWAAQLSEKLIEISFDMWNNCNKVLHKTDNNITEQHHNELNEKIQTIYSGLPNMQLFTATERCFFRHSTANKVQNLNIHRKRQWIKRATSIINAFEMKQNDNTTGNAHILLRAIGIPQHNRESRTSITQRTQTNNTYKTANQKTKQTNKTKYKNKKIQQYMSKRNAHKEQCNFKDSR